jgi:LysM repeat protein
MRAKEFTPIEEDISRRGFLRGLGAAGASAVAGGALAKSNPVLRVTVGQGDTIYSIARNFDVSPEEIYKLNGMNRNTRLNPNQEIKVPDVGEPIPVTNKAKHPPGSPADEFAQAIDQDDVIGQIATGKLDPKSIKSRPEPHNTPAHKAVKKPKVEIRQPAGSVPWQDIAQYCKSRWKMTREQIAGILANIKVESQFKADDLHMDSNGLPAGGLFSHNGPRLEQLVRKLGKDWKQNWQGQIDFALSEPDGVKYKSRHYSTPDAASRAWTIGFERPAHAQKQADKRAPAANQYASNI